MAKKFTATLKGDKELIANLKKVKAGAAKVLQQAVMGGAGIIETAADKGAPGAYNVQQLVAEETTTTRAVAAIGPDREHWYYTFFETGTQPHEATPRVKQALMLMPAGEPVVRLITRSGGMAAQPFLRPAIENTQPAVTAKVGGIFWAEISKAAQG